MTAVDVDALEAARAAATAGPWGLDFNEWMDGSRVVAMDDDSEDDGITPEIAWNDAALIVAAVNALPELLAEVRRGRALREAVEGLAEDWDRTAAIFPEYGDLSAAAARSLRDVLAAADGTP